MLCPLGKILPFFEASKVFKPKKSRFLKTHFDSPGCERPGGLEPPLFTLQRVPFYCSQTRTAMGLGYWSVLERTLNSDLYRYYRIQIRVMSLQYT